MNSILSEKELKKLHRPVREEALVVPKIMHFGPGAFFRSFVASLIDDVNQKDIEQWGIIAVSLHSEDTFNKLAGQDLVFNTWSMSKTKKRVQKISSISDFFVAKKEGHSVLDALSDEQIEIVSLTITEKGYHYNLDKKELDFSNQNIIDDLGNLEKAYFVFPNSVPETNASERTLISENELPLDEEVKSLFSESTSNILKKIFLQIAVSNNMHAIKGDTYDN